MYNNSRLKTYEKCPRRYYYEAILRLRRIGSWADVDREEGTMLHDVFAELYDPKQADPEAAARQVIHAYYAKLINAAELDIEVDEHTARRDYMFELFQAYLKRYPTETWVVLDVEKSGFTVLGDECHKCGEPYPDEWIRGEEAGTECRWCKAAPHFVAGQADLILRDNGVKKIADHKTKGGKSPSVSDQFLASFTESRQFTQYMYIFSRVEGEPIEMGIANCVAKLKTIDKRGNPFKRNIEIVRTQRDFDEYVKDTISLIEAIEADAAQLEENNVPKEDAHPFRRNVDACRDFGLCPFYAICHPSRPDWWKVPYDVAGDYEKAPNRYVDEMQELIKEEVQ